MEIKEKVRGFLGRYLRKYDLKDDEDIFSLGFVNSLFSMQLVMFLEKEFELVVDNEDLDLSNFKSIDSITSFVEKKIKNN
ncbi:MAG: acyl carrier protein [Clostridium sp.]|nr:acyl carrier protein [Clostridium sp.]